MFKVWLKRKSNWSLFYSTKCRCTKCNFPKCWGILAIRNSGFAPFLIRILRHMNQHESKWSVLSRSCKSKIEDDPEAFKIFSFDRFLGNRPPRHFVKRPFDKRLFDYVWCNQNLSTLVLLNHLMCDEAPLTTCRSFDEISLICNRPLSLDLFWSSFSC